MGYFFGPEFRFFFGLSTGSSRERQLSRYGKGSTLKKLKTKIKIKTMMSRSDWTTKPNYIRRFRQQRNLRLRDVARLIGIRESTHIAEWETGKRTPGLENVLKLSAVLGCPVEVLYSNHYQQIRNEVLERKLQLREISQIKN